MSRWTARRTPARQRVRVDRRTFVASTPSRTVNVGKSSSTRTEQPWVALIGFPEGVCERRRQDRAPPRFLVWSKARVYSLAALRTHRADDLSLTDRVQCLPVSGRDAALDKPHRAIAEQGIDPARMAALRPDVNARIRTNRSARNLLARLVHTEHGLTEQVADGWAAIDVLERVGWEPRVVRITAGYARPDQSTDVVLRPLEDLGHEDRLAEPVGHRRERDWTGIALAEGRLEEHERTAPHHAGRLSPVGVAPTDRVIPLGQARLAQCTPLIAGRILEGILPVAGALHDAHLGRGHRAIGGETHVPWSLGAEREVKGVVERLLFELGQHQDEPVGPLAARERIVAVAAELACLPDPPRNDHVVDP